MKPSPLASSPLIPRALALLELTSHCGLWAEFMTLTSLPVTLATADPLPTRSRKVARRGLAVVGLFVSEIRIGVRSAPAQAGAFPAQRVVCQNEGNSHAICSAASCGISWIYRMRRGQHHSAATDHDSRDPAADHYLRDAGSIHLHDDNSAENILIHTLDRWPQAAGAKALLRLR